MANALLDFVERYGPPAGEDGPVRMVQEVFGVTLDPWQERVLRAYGGGERRITIRACHGPGKTALASWLVWHMLLTKFPQKTVATAPSSSQLKGALLPEVKMWGKMMPPILLDLFDVKSEGIYLREAPEASYFEARTARAEAPEALQGVHSDHVLLIADEASGVPEQIFEAAVGSMSGANATTLLLGNPVRSSGFFFDTHRPESTWFKVHVSIDDSSRVTEEFRQQVIEQYGEDSNAYRVRVLGEFPKADLDAAIPFEWVESARQRDLVLPEGMTEVWGVDPARFGDDSTAFVRRTSLAVLPDVRKWDGLDTMQVTGRIKALWDETPDYRKPEWILVDVIGIGSGIVDRLRELGLPVRGVNVAESPSSTEQFSRLRDELWWKAREWLQGRNVQLPKHDETCACSDRRVCPRELLARQLTSVKMDYTSSGKIQIESKSEMKRRGEKSPDVADAFVLTFASEPASMIHGTRDSRSWATNWNRPVRRNRVLV